MYKVIVNWLKAKLFPVSLFSIPGPHQRDLCRGHLEGRPCRRWLLPTASATKVVRPERLPTHHWLSFSTCK